MPAMAGAFLEPGDVLPLHRIAAAITEVVRGGPLPRAADVAHMGDRYRQAFSRPHAEVFLVSFALAGKFPIDERLKPKALWRGQVIIGAMLGMALMSPSTT